VSDTHAIVLRRSPPIDLSEPSALFRLFGKISSWRTKHHLISAGGLEVIIAKHWSKGLQSTKTASGHAIQAARQLSFVRQQRSSRSAAFYGPLSQRVAQRGYECFASHDICKSDICQDFMLFVASTTQTHRVIEL